MSGSGGRYNIDGPAAFQQHFGVSRETVEKLETYEALLKRWQKTINLVAPSTLETIWHRHFADSAQLAPLIPETAVNRLDLGSGAGFPGLILAIMAANTSSIRHTLIESDSRKAAFLREVARNTGVAVDIVVERIEKVPTRVKLALFDCVTARALAALEQLCELAQPFLAGHAMCLFLKGREVESEVTTARASWAFNAAYVPSITDPDGRIICLSGLRRVTEG